jgi:hypothetical protein
MFKVGDFVKGNDNHCNPARMEDLGVVVETPDSVYGLWVCWTSDLSKHYAEAYELTLVKATF